MLESKIYVTIHIYEKYEVKIKNWKKITTVLVFTGIPFPIKSDLLER